MTLAMPLDFIPLAEETGLVVQIGTWVLREACRQGDVLQRTVPEAAPLHVAVDLSARQLQRPDTVQEIAKALLEIGLPPELRRGAMWAGSVALQGDGERAGGRMSGESRLRRERAV